MYQIWGRLLVERVCLYPCVQTEKGKTNNQMCHNEENLDEKNEAAPHGTGFMIHKVPCDWLYGGAIHSRA